jgi:hypothetical protein
MNDVAHAWGAGQRPARNERGPAAFGIDLDFGRLIGGRVSVD